MTFIRRGFDHFNEPKYSARAVPKTISKVGCVFPRVDASILPYEEFGPNDHRKDAPQVIHSKWGFTSQNQGTPGYFSMAPCQ